MRPIEYQLPKHKQPVFSACKKVLRVFIRRVRVVCLGGGAENKCLYVANHVNKMGPVKYDMFFPVCHVKWGAHQMLGNYASRRAYLRDVLYMQKNGMKRGPAAFKAFFEAFFSKYFYRGLKFLPTYPDARLVRTVRKSVDVLDDDTALMIYPENSEDGYHDVMKSFFPGFVLVMEAYFKKHGEDIPVRPVYYHKKKRLMVVGEECCLQDFSRNGYDRKGIAEIFKDKVNDLYARIERGEFDLPASKKRGKRGKKQKNP